MKRFRGDAVNWVKENVKTVDDIFNKAPIGCYHYDPICYAPLIDRPVLFLKAAFDKIMPKNATEDLEALLPNKTVKNIPTGHKSSIVLRRRILKWSMQFFNNM
jgi:pimeloyl-ACP methyl ester carboxylesterase